MPHPIVAPLFAFSFIQPPPAAAGEQLLPGAIEQVAELPINPGNLAVTAEGRVFATGHQFRRADVQFIEIAGPEGYRPWPDKAWNGAFGSGPDVLNSVLGSRRFTASPALRAEDVDLVVGGWGRCGSFLTAPYGACERWTHPRLWPFLAGGPMPCAGAPRDTRWSGTRPWGWRQRGAGGIV